MNRSACTDRVPKSHHPEDAYHKKAQPFNNLRPNRQRTALLRNRCTGSQQFFHQRDLVLTARHPAVQLRAQYRVQKLPEARSFGDS
jgi:hypothetical protein